MTLPAGVTGTQQNIVNRLISDLPNKWFGNISQANTPKLYALLEGSANTSAYIFNFIEFADLQTRIQTSTGIYLDYTSLDYFDGALPRHQGENDTSFRKRILANLLLERATRPAMVQVLTLLTGRAPIIIEGFDPYDCGCYDQTLFYWSWDQLTPPNTWWEGYGWSQPYTAIIIAFRVAPTGLFGRGGFDTFTGDDMVVRPAGFFYGAPFDYEPYLSGYNGYIDLLEEAVDVSDQDIINAVQQTKVFGTKIYLYIVNPPNIIDP